MTEVCLPFSPTGLLSVPLWVLAAAAVVVLWHGEQTGGHHHVPGPEDHQWCEHACFILYVHFCWSVCTNIENWWIFVWLWQVKYTEEYEQSKGKGSFPAMITPGYQTAKQASTLASNVSLIWCLYFLIPLRSKIVSPTEYGCLLKRIEQRFLFLQVEYKKGHEERVSKYTAFVDPPEVLLAKKQGQIVSDVRPS